MSTRAVSASHKQAESVRLRLLEGAHRILAQHGPRKLSLTDVAASAGVSRVTLYKYFPTKEDLLTALALHETERFEAAFVCAVHGLTGSDRVDAALRYVVAVQDEHFTRGLLNTEPAFVLAELRRLLRPMRSALAPLFVDLDPEPEPAIPHVERADMVIRLVFSHVLMRGEDDAQLLRELRAASGIPVPGRKQRTR
jgi:AcrR family transcriptional regulator